MIAFVYWGAFPEIRSFQKALDYLLSNSTDSKSSLWFWKRYSFLALIQTQSSMSFPMIKSFCGENYPKSFSHNKNIGKFYEYIYQKRNIRVSYKEISSNLIELRFIWLRSVLYSWIFFPLFFWLFLYKDLPFLKLINRFLVLCNMYTDFNETSGTDVNTFEYGRMKTIFHQPLQDQ